MENKEEDAVFNIDLDDDEDDEDDEEDDI